MHKAGTTSLARFFGMLGLRASHSIDWSQLPLDHEFIRSHDAFADGGGHFWDEAKEFGSNHEVRHLDKEFPGSKFILQFRDLESWLVSKLDHAGWQQDDRLTQECGPFAHEDWKKFRSIAVVAAWIENRYRYHQAVLNYFSDRPADLLTVDITRDPAALRKIVDFIGGFEKVRPVSNFNKYHKLQNKYGFGIKFVPIRLPKANSSTRDPAKTIFLKKIARKAMESVSDKMRRDPMIGLCDSPRIPISPRLEQA